ncbi:unknown [Prevotella sp. CAG:386]|nr:unknown [Prevotella sp. CAG:386]
MLNCRHIIALIKHDITNLRMCNSPQAQMFIGCNVIQDLMIIIQCLW